MRYMTRPLISVIVPNYNTAATIDACAASILASSWQEIEVLLVNDGSTDETLSHLQALEAADPRVRVVDLPKNSGLPAARNAGIKVARGEYVSFVDGDDLVHADMLEKMMAIAEETDADLVYSAITEEEQALFSKVNGVCEKAEFVRWHLLEEIRPWVWRGLYRRELFAKQPKLLFDEKMRILEDAEFSYRFAEAAKTIAVTGEVLYDYEEGRTGSMSSRSKETSWDFYRAIVGFRKYEYARRKCNPEIRDAVLLKAVRHAVNAWYVYYGDAEKTKEWNTMQARFLRYREAIEALAMPKGLKMVVGILYKGGPVTHRLFARVYPIYRDIRMGRA